MWIVIGVIALVLILLFIVSNAGQKQIRLHLTAEHQRLQREQPEHDEAKMGLEEFILSRLNEITEAKNRNKKTIIRFAGIGGVIAAALALIIGNILIYDGFEISTILIFG